ncbi:probable LRR receptor-like serine/threonine-protein kinase At3g47570 isoform X5 [Citrus sinensis]|uniref:probable LRR receptor-like serine/threonine-protein kinase At3g47570 isoform X5 n=1 Tax=Citrus sinensis TaxID=2711 RepID=UPI0022775FB7|nr:probable LRR receptor-like serine/threonine-protein kinase At3g47570 isoform X5 [Citrus sinensis]
MERNFSLSMITVSLTHCLLLCLVVAAAAAAAASNNITTDQQALLALKDHIIYDPTNLLAHNWTSNTSVCTWIGITCDVNSHRVTALDISQFNLQGTIPPQLGNLSSLTTLNLSHNKLSGSVPSSIYTMHRLKFLDFTDNQLSGSVSSFVFNMSSILDIRLTNNRLSGELPKNICNYLPHLKALFLDKNMFHSKIPSALSKCKQLQQLNLQFNNLSGAIPKEIGNLTRLKGIYLGANKLHGEIPHEIANLRNLGDLVLGMNNLVGVLPAPIFNMSTLKVLILINNSLSGSLPSRIDLSLPTVEVLILSLNRFSGTIPSSITNASKLALLELGVNTFSGFIPNTIGNLRNLEWLGLGNNYLTSSTSKLSFLSSLANCKKLRDIGLTGNPLNGILPSSIGNLSMSLKTLYIGNCSISGNIPQSIGNLSNLLALVLELNKLTGPIPTTFGRLQKLQGLYLAFNKLVGSFPDELCHLGRLDKLVLFGNKLSGSIPSCLSNLTSLRSLYLGSNRFTSVIPSTFWSLKDILFFDFSSNFLVGPLSSDIGNLKVLLGINLSENNLSGDMPATIGGLKDLQIMDLAYNRLEGPIPESFGDLISLEVLNLSNNKISGSIPKSLGKLFYLRELNLSFNELEGEIPSGGIFANFTAESFMGNELLCGLPNLQVQPCKVSKPRTEHKSRKKILLIVIVLPLSIALTIAITLALQSKLIECGKRSTVLSNDSILSSQATLRRFSYLELLQATDNFAENSIIGRGGFGSVYGARLEDGMKIAIKVFHQQCASALKSFEAECEVLKNIRHRNLIKVISSCSNDDFKALVLEYMSNGSLGDWLHSSNYVLNIFQRLNIMIDVASALEYLHFDHSTPIIHCDLKPSNVLLDENMVAHLSDFGIAKLLSGEDESTMRTKTLATIGYMAPEYGIEGEVSTKSDVYSYGIMLMETFTKKKPTDEIFVGELSLKRWVNDLLPTSLEEVVDKTLLSGEEKHSLGKEQCLLSIFSLALECTMESPEKRINAKDIVTGLLKIKAALSKRIGNLS